jgi:hypothetical protein|eukprot:jgi/Chrpa1/26139/Chrysochromulina_OHIO_Genome00026504-RA
MKLCLPKDLKVGDRVQAQGHAACGLDPCINQVGVCMRCLWKVKEACDDAAVRRTAVLNSLLSHVDPGPRVKGFEGIAPLMRPCCVEDVTGTALAGNVHTSQLLPALCLMMRTVCV